jgi:hypothetical protein
MMHAQIPEPLAAAFRERVTISAPELCRLLPLDAKTLRGHIRLGHIDYVQTGLGDTFPRKAFTLAAVLRFLAARERTEFPSTSPSVPRSTPTTSGVVGSGILARRERRTIEKLTQNSGDVSGITELLER